MKLDDFEGFKTSEKPTCHIGNYHIGNLSSITFNHIGNYHVGNISSIIKPKSSMLRPDQASLTKDRLFRTMKLDDFEGFKTSEKRTCHFSQ